ncbi:MAG: hypothetical protein BWY43_00433 [candidate division WS2 bacterium ADurb.Bin280]|uniref:Uncharacterized protein n=1 Tax=candidate division WS2 bacterium ADurb.Bin280 TaxID=1852829 RepID=A0A1V5SEE8_9BACT|nr:MAG: hypothetical protein BWY43_00433 [candidate division WS2 bacterium ADurb.Bin280]
MIRIILAPLTEFSLKKASLNFSITQYILSESLLKLIILTIDVGGLDKSFGPAIIVIAEKEGCTNFSAQHLLILHYPSLAPVKVGFG